MEEEIINNIISMNQETINIDSMLKVKALIIEEEIKFLKNILNNIISNYIQIVRV